MFCFVLFCFTARLFACAVVDPWQLGWGGIHRTPQCYIYLELLFCKT